MRGAFGWAAKGLREERDHRLEDAEDEWEVELGREGEKGLRDGREGGAERWRILRRRSTPAVARRRRRLFDVARRLLSIDRFREGTEERRENEASGVVWHACK